MDMAALFLAWFRGLWRAWTASPEVLLDLHTIKTCARTRRIADGFDGAISGDRCQRVPSRIREVAFILQLVVKPGLGREGDVNLGAGASCADCENRD